MRDDPLGTALPQNPTGMGLDDTPLSAASLKQEICWLVELVRPVDFELAVEVASEVLPPNLSCPAWLAL